jgi:hypothetical protein
MTNEELVQKAIEWLRKMEPKLPERVRDVTVDRLPKRCVRDAVVIDFTTDEHHGAIRVVMERDTGAFIGTTHTPSESKPK